MEYVMQLSNDTINVLKNFGAINQGILFKKGKVLKTMSSGKNILAEVTIKEDIPTEFGIYDLNKFLSVVSLHKDNPTFEFGDKEVKIVGNKGRSKMKYRFCEPTMIVTPPEKQLAMPNPEVSFSLSAEDFDWVMKALVFLVHHKLQLNRMVLKLQLQHLIRLIVRHTPMHLKLLMVMVISSDLSLRQSTLLSCLVVPMMFKSHLKVSLTSNTRP
jgi:hypothetical protein